MAKRLLMISTDRKIFEEGSAVRTRQIEYAKDWDEVHIVVFGKKESGKWKKEKGKYGEIVIAPNCWAYSTRSWSKFLYPFDAMRLGRFIMEKRGITDITCQDASLTSMAGVSLKKRFKGKTSNAITLEIQVHEDIGSPNYSFNWTNKVRKFLALNYLPKADSIRVVSERIKRYLVGNLGINESKVIVRPIMIHAESIKNASIINGADLHKKYPQFDKIVLMAGRLEPEKNVGLALEAWPLVIEKHPKAGLIIVGDGSLKSRLERQAKGLKASAGEAIIFESWVDKPTLISYYKTADLFLNTSLFEGYGMALIEANAAKCKIVSTDVGVSREINAIITDRGAERGVLIVDWNKQSVADGISEIFITRP
jgi:glycosyltransferase involved in cell wall biosynthesis